MSAAFESLIATPSVLTARQRYDGVRRPPAPAGQPAPLGPREQAFIAARDSFYLATVGESGWPHVQHRGGPAGFLRVLAPDRLGFADYRGNRQYVSVGNLLHDDRVALILVDYPQRQRLKILGRARIVDAGGAGAPEIAGFRPPPGGASVERFLLIEVAAWDWNCAAHITPRYTEAEWSGLATPGREARASS